MRIIDRLIYYLQHKRISIYAFERRCQVANGYIKKQEKGKGTIGSDILEKIYRNYEDLNILWLLTGEQNMIREDVEIRNMLREGRHYYSKDEIIQHLKERVSILETYLSDKEKIIGMLEKKPVADDRRMIKTR